MSILGDGDCLFSALSASLRAYGVRASIQELRTIAAKHLRSTIGQQNINSLKVPTLYHSLQTEADESSYLDAIAQGLRCGDSNCISALASALKLHITVIDSVTKTSITFGNLNDLKVFLGYHPSHFNWYWPRNAIRNVNSKFVHLKGQKN